MDYSNRTRTVTAYLTDIKKEKLSFDHKVQRRGNQWSRAQKIELIKTLIQGHMPIPPIHVSKDKDGKMWVIDGKQRLTTINDYVNGKFSLPVDTEITVEGKKYDLSRKRFPKLEEEIKSRITETEILQVTYTDCDYDECAKIYTVLNNGTPLSNAQKIRAQIPANILDAVDEVSSSEFFDSVPFTRAQLKKGEDLILILQAAILANEYDFKSFGGRDILSYAQSCKPADINKIKKACDDLSKFTKDSDKKDRQGGYKKINIPMLFAGMAVSKDKKKFFENFTKFDKGYEKNTKYREFCAVGTSKKENVLGRWEYFKKNINA
ncbi:MAG: DUF262 domain-containing protein [Eubacterium sp.]|nr:DUF262 domain-containing protein [Eubacterium sp.]